MDTANIKQLTEDFISVNEQIINTEAMHGSITIEENNTNKNEYEGENVLDEINIDLKRGNVNFKCLFPYDVKTKNKEILMSALVPSNFKKFFSGPNTFDYWVNLQNQKDGCIYLVIKDNVIKVYLNKNKIGSYNYSGSKLSTKQYKQNSKKTFEFDKRRVGSFKEGISLILPSSIFL